MNQNRLLDSPAKVGALAEKLAACHDVAKYPPRDGEPESAVLAYTFSELEGSFIKLLRDHLPKLVDSAVHGEQLEEILDDIGEELRHVLYHLGDSRYYSYLPVQRVADGEGDDS